MSNFDDAIAITLRHEGSQYTNIPGDAGGPTKFGITLATLRRYNPNKNVTYTDVQSLTEGQAKLIYKQLFWDTLSLDGLQSKKVCAVIFDQSVLRGPGGVVKAAQRSCGVVADGQLGPATIEALNAANENAVALDVLGNSLSFYAQLVARDHTQSMFLSGWVNRCTDLLNFCFRGNV